MTVPRLFSTSTSTALVGAALMATHTLVSAQVAPPALAECAAVASDHERLACFDRISGRAVPPAPEQKQGAAATPTPGTPASEAAAKTGAAPAPGGSASMIDKAWGFDPSSSRYDLSLYAPNYFLFG
ncbi:MAG: hypothetical protein ACRC2B_10020, partial [Rubrivivax sp.]